VKTQFAGSAIHKEIVWLFRVKGNKGIPYQLKVGNEIIMVSPYLPYLSALFGYPDYMVLAFPLLVA
jgi:hypothetical protein